MLIFFFISVDIFHLFISLKWQILFSFTLVRTSQGAGMFRIQTSRTPLENPLCVATWSWGRVYVYISICSLIHGISIFSSYLIPNPIPVFLGQQWYYLTHRWKDKGAHTFPNGICLKVDVLVRLECKLAYYDSSVQRFNHYTTGTPTGTPTGKGLHTYIHTYWKRCRHMSEKELVDLSINLSIDWSIIFLLIDIHDTSDTNIST